MDMMELRFRMMAMIGGNNSVWKQKQITAPQNFTMLGDVKTWLDSVIPTSDIVWVLNDTLTKVNYYFAGTLYFDGKNTYHFCIMSNGNGNSRGTNNAEAAEVLNAGDTLTIFYQ